MNAPKTEAASPPVRSGAWLAVANYRRARLAEKDRWGVGGVRAQLWEKDIREFGISVRRDSAKRLTLMEPVSCTAPSIARPYCCYINTVIFYVWPYVVVKPRTGPWKDTSPGNFLEWERIETILSWNERIVFDGQQYEVAGGRVIRHSKTWWMKRDARLHEPPVRWAAGVGVCDGNGESKSAAQTANDQTEAPPH